MEPIRYKFQSNWPPINPSPAQFELNSNHEDTQLTLEETLEDFMQFSKQFLSTNV